MGLAMGAETTWIKLVKGENSVCRVEDHTFVVGFECFRRLESERTLVPGEYETPEPSCRVRVSEG